MKRTLFLTCTLLLLLISCSTPSVEVYENENAGIQFDLPEDWQILDESSRMILSPDESLLNEEAFESGARVIFVSFPKSTLTVPTIDTLLAANIDPFLNTPNAEQVQPTETFTIDGHPAISAAVEGINIRNASMIWKSVVMEGETTIVLAFIEVSKDQEAFFEVAEEIVSSVEYLVVFQ